jgi:DNA-binding protein HU-beta
MTKTELQLALAQATQTNKKTAGLFLDTLSALAYKTIKKNGEFVLPGFGKLVKQKRKARTGFNPKTQQKIRIPAKTASVSPNQAACPHIKLGMNHKYEGMKNPEGYDSGQVVERAVIEF